MSKPELTDHEATKRAAQYMLRNGFATYSEIAALAGLSRQAVRMWSVKLGNEYAREKYVLKVWQAALQRVREPNPSDPVTRQTPHRS